MRDELWIEQVIAEAIESGELEPTEGVGEPIEGLDRPHDPLWWVRSWVQREGLDDTTRPRRPKNDSAGPDASREDDR